MLNELITWVLNTYLGKYIEDFNPTQLSVALVSGEVELENVPIRRDALRSFGIPVQALAGSIGKIKLHIPVRQFRTSPWCITIERIYGVFSAKDLKDWDCDTESQAEYEYKLGILEAKEGNWRVENGCDLENYYSSSYTTWLNYGASLATNILENLELKINDIHLRYEDTLTTPKSPFAAGIRLKSLSVQTCDANWVTGAKLAANQAISFKLLELRDLFLYWDPLNEENACSKLISKNLLEQMNDKCKIADHHFVVSPINATVKFKRELCKQPIRTKERPRISCDMFVPQLQLLFNVTQYTQMLECYSNLENLKRVGAFKLLKPHCPVLKNAKLWWKYVLQCHGYYIYSTEEKLEIIKQNLRYIKLYKRLLLNPNENLTKEERQFKCDLEKSRSLDDLQALREVTCEHIRCKDILMRNRNVNHGKGLLYHWFPNWWGWYNNTTDNSSKQEGTPNSDDTYQHIEDDILSVLKETIENDTFSKKDAIFAHLTFTLSDGRILLTATNLENNYDESGILEMEIKDLLSFVEIKPKLSTYRLGISLGSVSLTDKLTPATEFPYLIRPQVPENYISNKSVYNELKHLFGNKVLNSNNALENEPWFQLQYEKSPPDYISDYRLVIKSKSLDVVYNENAWKWLITFFITPLGKRKQTQPNVRYRSENTARLKFFKTWKNMFVIQEHHQKKWSFEIDIFAPRIICAENFREKNTSVVLIDFGRFQLLKNERLRKQETAPQSTAAAVIITEAGTHDSDDDMFMTPCSTPPGSQVSRCDSPTYKIEHATTSVSSKFVINKDTGLENALYNDIYDKYFINLTDLQVIVCKSKECAYACSKSSSNVHLLDKFNISLQIERRKIVTTDPDYPFFTVTGNLTKIVAHINEHKISECLKILSPVHFDLYKVSTSSSSSENNVNINQHTKATVDDEEEVTVSCNNLSNIDDNLSTKTAIFKFAIGQIILEVQSHEKSIAELQVIGIKVGVSKRFEDLNINITVHGLLLVDAIQSFGPDFELLVASHRHVEIDSISGSIKQSQPCSPISPQSPRGINQHSETLGDIDLAIIDLQSVKRKKYEDDALITVDIQIIESSAVDGEEPLQIINITFNNLDVIANQETIVELLGFGKRILDMCNLLEQTAATTRKRQTLNNNTQLYQASSFSSRRTEISFDFHRLNILVLRSIKCENHYIGHKVGTLTMSEAKIHATVGGELNATGELGGIQIVDITSEGSNHPRIFSVGKDPLTHNTNDRDDDSLANETHGAGTTDAAEQHYCTNALYFEIRQSSDSKVYITIRMASVWYTHCPRFIEEIYFCVKEFRQYFKNFVKSLRHKATYMAKGFVEQIGSNSLQYKKKGEIALDIVLSSPVLVLPRSCESTDVLVANLGRITVYNNRENVKSSLVTHKSGEIDSWTKDTYFIDVRNINLFSLNTTKRKQLYKNALPKANAYYSCKTDAVAILYDTALIFQCIYDSKMVKVRDNWKGEYALLIEGTITENLHVSLSKCQYEQLNEAVNYATKLILYKESGDTTKETTPSFGVQHKQSMAFQKVTLQFSVPVLKVDLKNEHNTSLIHLTLEEFSFESTDTASERQLKTLLRSVLMEDLKCATDSKYRNMVDSSNLSSQIRPKPMSKTKLSLSCPNMTQTGNDSGNLNVSMPMNLNKESNATLQEANSLKTPKRSVNLPAKPTNTMDNLVLYNTIITKATNALESDTIKSSIDFNCLNLTISIEKWFMIFDFFGIISDQMTNGQYEKETTANRNLSTRILLVTINSLNLILVRSETELARANVSNARLQLIKEGTLKVLEGCLGSISIFDLTPFGYLYQEKFSTTGEEALSFSYKTTDNNEAAEQDNERSALKQSAHLLIKMSSVKYVHTKRFTMEFYLFVNELLQLQSPVMSRIKSHDAMDNKTNNILMGLEIYVDSPIMLLPVSYHSNHLLIADLGKFTLTNSFHYGPDVPPLAEKLIVEEEEKGARERNIHEIVDVMNIELMNINLLTGEWLRDGVGKCLSAASGPENIIYLGNCGIIKFGNGIFKEKCHLKLQLIRNTESHKSHNLPDIIVKGTLSELNGLIELKQYKLIRGFFNYNLGETIDDVYYNYRVNLTESLERLNSLIKISAPHKLSPVWKTLSINFLLKNVIIYLAEAREGGGTTGDCDEATLACIKFIKSTLDIDSFSDGSQDIDLISSEILIMDVREFVTPPFSTKNVFKYILKPSTEGSMKSTVQVEVHSRVRNGAAKYIIMLNNMRIMAILDYLERLKNFLQEEPYMSSVTTETPSGSKRCSVKPSPIYVNQQTQKEDPNQHQKYEFVLNITNSEVIFVENTEEMDTNAIILKSTTVFSYKPGNTVVPISIDINHLEVFSCILGSESESSLSIIDPFTLNMELRNNCLQILIQNQLFVRVSYNDAILFTRILRSIPKQTKPTQRTPPSAQAEHMAFEKIAPLVAMGFKQTLCWSAMEACGHNLNEAAIWLSQQKQGKLMSNAQEKITSVSVNANCISVCIIDDCLDADVPLLEFAMSRLVVNQKIQLTPGQSNSASVRCYEGELETVIACDYYNRYLSGWEPIIESWECACSWNYSHSSSLPLRRLSMAVNSKQLLKLNITSALIELYALVQKNWMEDYFGRTTKYAANFKRRQPFVPFALKNLTGEPMLFKIFCSQAGGVAHTTLTKHELMCNWIPVQHNEMVPFDFGPQSKQRHLDSHKLNMHQILVQIHNWTLIGPISIDKVGVFFRYANLDMQYNKKTRIVFDISLFGSAQKLITIRSALSVVNNTCKKFTLRLQMKNDNESIMPVIEPLQRWSVPLRYLDSLICFKPSDSLNEEEISNLTAALNDEDEDEEALTKRRISMKTVQNQEVGFCTKPISWTDCEAQDAVQQMCSSYSLNRTVAFHILTDIRKDNFPTRETGHLPGHTISLMPPLKLKNLLCCDLLYKISGHVQGRINASEEIEIYSVNVNESFCLTITLDNYRLSGQLKIPTGHSGIVEPKLKLIDVLNRELSLRVSIQSLAGKGMEIYISAPIWIINKTGIPLIFRQEGTNRLASGQFEEHEHAREVSPLMFSFSDQEGAPLLEIRLGKTYGDNNPWCKGFSIHKEITFRDLKAEKSKKNYVVGVNVQRGKGVYCCSTFVTLSPRFQLYNRSTHTLEFAQIYDVNHEKPAFEKIITALPGSNFPFHWSNCEQEPLLCVRTVGKEFHHWSHGFPINEAKSVYINIRNDIGEMIFLRLEVISHGGTYLLHFTDAQTLPPPLRIDNYSEVSIHFYQKHSHWRTTVKSRSSLAYVLDNPMGSKVLHIEAPGGNYTDFALSKNDVTKSITYANFIYIAFKETFSCSFSDGNDGNDSIDTQQLVLSVKDRHVIMTRKRPGDRSQLWLMNSYGQLEHEGSSPPLEYFRVDDAGSLRLVLDLDKPPNPTECTKLVVRPQNNQRVTTQTWRFENGRLMCHANMCVQPLNGIYGLKAGCEAVLGRIDSGSRVLNANGIPIEQSIEIQKLRPGSGHLEVFSRMDGPIRAIQIRDVKESLEKIILSPDPSWKQTSIFNKGRIDKRSKSALDECVIKLSLTKGLGLSVVTRTPCEELTYITLEDIVLDVISSPYVKAFDLKVGDLQIDNQLLDTPCPILVYTSKSNVEDLPKEAVILKAKILPSPNKNATIFEYITFELKPCIVCLEERMILKSALFLGNHGVAKQCKTLPHSEMNVYRIDDYSFSQNAKRFYFENLVIGSTQVRLSVLTASKLSPKLMEMKKSLGLTLIKFEDALIEFDRFTDKHRFETLEVYFKAFRTHYINQLKWHAASILGSVDFLGNPLGFANDLSEGVSGLIFEGSVKSLVKNVTHGISNSTAKLTETLSDSLGRVVLDDHDNETRQKILEVAYPTTGGHLAAGLKGLGFGLLGGVTSIVRQTYAGAHSDGFPGFLSGLGKGLVGTVTKPIIGVLDLASETASAVRETSRGSHRSLPERKRLPRCVTGASGGLLPSYSYRQSKGQQYLYLINHRNFEEKLIFYEPNLWNDKEAKIRLLVSTEFIRIFSTCEAMLFESHLSDFLSCHPLTTNPTSQSNSSKTVPLTYIEISTNLPKITRPRFRCQNEEIAERASRSVNYAKAAFDERELSLILF